MLAGSENPRQEGAQQGPPATSLLPRSTLTQAKLPNFSKPYAEKSQAEQSRKD